MANEFHSEPVVLGDIVVTGSDLRESGAIAHIYAFDRENGTVRWKHDLEMGVAGSILTYGSNIYAMSFQQSLVGLDVASGKQVTPVERPSANPNWIFPASPVISNDKLFYAKRDGIIQAINAKDHRSIWSRKVSEQITSDLVVNGNSIFLSTDGKKIYRLSQNDGTITQTFTTTGTARWKILSVGSDLVFLEWDDGNIPTLKCLDATSGKTRWSQPSPEQSEWDTFRPLAWKNLVIVGSKAGHVSAFDSNSGKAVWSTKVQGNVRMLGGSEHFVYAGCSNGLLYALLPES